MGTWNESKSSYRGRSHGRGEINWYHGWNKIYHEKSAEIIVPHVANNRGKGWTLGGESKNVTDKEIKCCQPQKEGSLQKNSSENEGYVGVYDSLKIVLRANQYDTEKDKNYGNNRIKK